MVGGWGGVVVGWGLQSHFHDQPNNCVEVVLGCVVVGVVTTMICLPTGQCQRRYVKLSRNKVSWLANF